MGHDAFLVARKGMEALGLLHVREGITYPQGVETGHPYWDGDPTCIWPTEALLSLAGVHGVTADRAKDAFRREVPTKPPHVGQPLQLRSLSTWRGRKRITGKPLRYDPEEPEARRLANQIVDLNAYAATFNVTGCVPPRWFRIFHLNWLLGGRWYAAGEDAYQSMSEADRVGRIRINGEPVVEVDAKASQLTILHGQCRLTLPEHDLYTIRDDLPRSAVKAWSTITQGKGYPADEWTDDTRAEDRAVDPQAIRDAMLAKYSFLNSLELIVPEELTATYGRPQRLVSLYLQWIEAQAITAAMGYVRSRGHLALPMHDGLIVAQSAERWAIEGLEGGYEAWANVTPRLDVERGDRQPS
ncbi:hypothetical protein [Roseomonas harenae]|uniref:hypothetical protein n=1 Tax=Muricoccus harenae TaxID=2692566 RepID=UPI00133131DE|nr:hypothetical protein [Roseomonas harenae]